MEEKFKQENNLPVNEQIVKSDELLDSNNNLVPSEQETTAFIEEQQNNQKFDRPRVDSFAKMMNQYKRIAADKKREARNNEFYKSKGEERRIAKKEAVRMNRKRARRER